MNNISLIALTVFLALPVIIAIGFALYAVVKDIHKHTDLW